MKKALGIVLLALTFSFVSAPAFAKQVELDLKYWYVGVGGADLWVADCSEYEEGDYVFDTEKLVLQPGMGGSFILSGSCFLSPSTSVGISYWGLSRADAVAKALDNEGAEFEEDGGYYKQRRSEKHYLLGVPWWDGHFPYGSSYREIWYADDEYDVYNNFSLLAGEAGFSMTALDISGMKALTGPGWEVGLSGGIRKAAFNQNQLIALESFDECEEMWHKYYEYWLETFSFRLDSRLSVSAIGPQVGIEGQYALGDKVMLKAGAKTGVLFGTAATDATWTVGYVDYYEQWHEDEKVYDDQDSWSEKVLYPATSSVQISTFDLSASLGYQITEQWSVEAGYHASVWKGVPSLYFFKYLKDDDNKYGDPEDIEDGYWTWEQPEARDIIVSGLTLGVNFKF